MFGINLAGKLYYESRLRMVWKRGQGNADWRDWTLWLGSDLPRHLSWSWTSRVKTNSGDENKTETTAS